MRLQDWEATIQMIVDECNREQTQTLRRLRLCIGSGQSLLHDRLTA